MTSDKIIMKYNAPVSHSLSFASFVDLAGKTDLEQLQADMIIDCLEDLLTPFSAMRRESDETRKVLYVLFWGWVPPAQKLCC